MDIPQAPPPPRAGLTIPFAVLTLAHLSVSARLVLAELWALWEQHGSNGGLPVPNAHFADRLWLSSRTVHQAVHDLAAAGYVLRGTDAADRRRRLLQPLPLPLPVASPATPAVQPLSNLVTAQCGPAQ